MVLNGFHERKVPMLHSSTEPLEVVLGAHTVHLVQACIKFVKHATKKVYMLSL